MNKNGGPSKEDIRLVLDLARSSIGDYCMNTCKANCCRKGSILLITPKEVEIVTSGENVGKRLVELSSGMHALDVETDSKNCPKLSEDFRCTVYERRPRACRDYPLFLVNDTVMAASTCMAVREGLLDAHLEKVKKMGLKVV